MTKLRPNWMQDEKSLACGENVSLSSASKDWRSVLDRVALGLFPPDLIIEVKAIACEFPAVHQVPLSRWSADEIARYACQSGLVATISGSTVWRWLNEDAIRPWQHRSWIFPRDPQFALKAGQILDLYQKVYNGHPLKDEEFVLSADEKTSIQARNRRHVSYPTQPHSPIKVEHEYKRLGAWAYLAALDVHRMKLFGRCEHKSGIASFGHLVDQVMSQPPYREARKVFWIVDNGSSHRGPKSAARLKEKYPNLVLIHGPVHASCGRQLRGSQK